jgi:hypothetical protein
VQIFANGAWTTYYVYDGSPPKWVKLGDDDLDDQGGVVLPPGQGMFVSKPQTASTMNMFSYGEVRDCDFIRPLQGPANNLVGGGFPIDQSANAASPLTYLYDREMNLTPTGFFGSQDFKTADSFFIWKGDASGSSAAGYDSYFLLNAPSVSMLRWVKVGDPAVNPKDSALLFLSDRSVFIRAASELPSYKIPRPWTP